MKYSEGEEVLAKHPTSAEYYKGKIMSIRGDQYKIQFEPGTELTVHQDDIRAGRPSRSTTRSSRVRRSPNKYSPSRRSPARRSPGRPQSAKRLTTRTTRPGRLLSRMNVTNTGAVNEDKNVPAKSTNENENPTDVMPLQSRLKEIGIPTRRSTRLLSSALRMESDHKTAMLMRNTNRAVSLPVERNAQFEEFTNLGKERGHSVQKDQILLKTVEYKDEFKVPTETVDKWTKEVVDINEPSEWGGKLGVFFLVFLFPLSIVLPQLICSENECTIDFRKLPTDLNYYFNLNAFAAYLGFLLFVAIVSIIPIGKRVDGQYNKIGRLQYRMNGLHCATLLMIIFSTLVYNGIGISNFILENFLQLTISGFLIGTILSVFLFVKASKAPLVNLNIYGSTKSTLYNFWQGREVNPRLGPLDFKIILLRASMIGMLAINLAIIFQAIDDTQSPYAEHLNIATFVATWLQIFYILDMLMFESAILTTFEVMYEGTGYMLCVGHLLYPFLPTLTTRFILYEKPSFSYLFGLFIVSYKIGYLLYRISNSQKNEVRRNLISSKLGYLETLPTTRGKKLILSGLWGYVRHPNYLGDIIMHWSIAAFSMSQNFLPYYPAICCTLALAYRARRDSDRCKNRYSSAWEQYTSRTKYMLINRVY